MTSQAQRWRSGICWGCLASQSFSHHTSLLWVFIIRTTASSIKYKNWCSWSPWTDTGFLFDRLEKTYSLKVENCILGTLPRTIIWEATLQIAMRDWSKEVGRERGYIEEFLLKKKKWKKTMSSTIKRLLLITKNRFPKLMILVVFYVWEVSRVWAHWNYSFAMHLNYLGPVACFLHPESPQGVPAPVAPMT